MAHIEKTIVIPQSSTRYQDVRCDNCSADLEPIDSTFADDYGWTVLQPADCLLVKLVGYYGSMYDPMTAGASMFFCLDCTTRLVSLFPAFKKALDEQ